MGIAHEQGWRLDWAVIPCSIFEVFWLQPMFHMSKWKMADVIQFKIGVTFGDITYFVICVCVLGIQNSAVNVELWDKRANDSFCGLKWDLDDLENPPSFCFEAGSNHVALFGWPWICLSLPECWDLKVLLCLSWEVDLPQLDFFYFGKRHWLKS